MARDRKRKGGRLSSPEVKEKRAKHDLKTDADGVILLVDSDDDAAAPTSAAARTPAAAPTPAAAACASATPAASATTTAHDELMPLLDFQLHHQSTIHTLTVSDYIKLGHKLFLTGFDIDFYLMFLVSRKYHALPSIDDTLIFATDTNRNLQWKSFGGFKPAIKGPEGNVFAKDFLVFPLNSNNHWYLAIIHNPVFALYPNELHKPTIYFLDSAKMIDTTQWEEHQRQLVWFLIEAAKFIRKKTITVVNVHIEYLPVPIQPEKSGDCGLYVLMYVEELIKGNKIPVFPDHIDYALNARYMRHWISQLIKYESQDQFGSRKFANFPKIKLPKIV